MNLRPIEIFVAVARCRSFSRAAERLHVAQSAVSIAVRRLERELGVILLQRTSRSVEVTPAGQRYLSQVQPALEQLILAGREARERDGVLQGVMVLASPAMVTQFALAQALVAFQAAHPELQLRLRQGGAEEIARWVLAGDVELGIVAERESRPELAIEPLMRLPNVAVVRAGSQLARLTKLPWRVLLQQPLVAFPQSYHQRWLIDHQAAKRKVAPRIALESENLGVIFAAVRAGLGVSTMPALAAQRQPQIATVRLETDDVLTVAACTRQGFPRSRAAQELLQHLRRNLTTGAR